MLSRHVPVNRHNVIIPSNNGRISPNDWKIGIAELLRLSDHEIADLTLVIDKITLRFSSGPATLELPKGNIDWMPPCPFRDPGFELPKEGIDWIPIRTYVTPKFQGTEDWIRDAYNREPLHDPECANRHRSFHVSLNDSVLLFYGLVKFGQSPGYGPLFIHGDEAPVYIWKSEHAFCCTIVPS